MRGSSEAARDRRLRCTPARPELSPAAPAQTRQRAGALARGAQIQDRDRGSRRSGLGSGVRAGECGQARQSSTHARGACRKPGPGSANKQTRTQAPVVIDAGGRLGAFQCCGRAQDAPPREKMLSRLVRSATSVLAMQRLAQIACGSRARCCRPCWRVV